jgi:hypothetical protein
MDVDVAVHMASANWDRLILVMNKMGLLPRVPIRPESLMDPLVLRAMVEDKKALVFTFIHPDEPSLQLDVFLRPELSYEALKPYALPMDIGGLSLQVVSPSKLLALKKEVQPARQKDLLDIAVLEAKNKKE